MRRSYPGGIQASRFLGDLNTSGSDGTWAAASGVLACSAVCTPTSHTSVPDGGTGSILLIDDVSYQDMWLSCEVTLGANCDNAGLVFGYVDRLNFWVKVYSKAQQAIKVYQVVNGAWTEHSPTETSISGTFTMTAEVRAGSADGYAATIPAGPGWPMGRRRRR